MLLDHQDELTPRDLAALRRASSGSTSTRFCEDLRRREHAARVAEDVASADASGVTGTPTFFINGRRHQGAYDIDDAHRGEVRAARPAEHGPVVEAPVDARAQALDVGAVDNDEIVGPGARLLRRSGCPGSTAR